MHGRRLFLILWFGAGAALASVPAADALWANGDYRGAFAQAIEPAQQGDAHAQFLIGEAYRLGRSVDPDLPQAADWYARAAHQGDLPAATELGLLLASQHHETEAAPWLTIAARRGEPRALCTLAALYYNGDGVARDEALAFALMSRAAAAGLPEAQARLETLRTLVPPELQAKGTALAAAIGAAATPAVPETAPARPAHTGLAAAAAAIRIQVGAFRSADAAERGWAMLAGKIDGLARTSHSVIRAGGFYRLQAHLGDEGTAADFCRRLRAAGWQHFTRETAGGMDAPPHRL